MMLHQRAFKKLMAHQVSEGISTFSTKRSFPNIGYFAVRSEPTMFYNTRGCLNWMYGLKHVRLDATNHVIRHT